MASAVLPSRNEQKWSDHGGYTSKFTKNPNFTRFNPNPNSTGFSTSRDVQWRNHNHDQQLPSSVPPPPPPEAAFSGSSIRSVPENSNGLRYIKYRLASYTRRELKELKKRLISDLDRVRILRHRICSPPIPKQEYRSPASLLAPEVKIIQKRAVGKKRTTPFTSLRDTKKKCVALKNKAHMKKCGQILAKLMKHKHGWVFNTPVDAAALRLYDYHTVIRNPMDLGTIKSKLGRNEYESPIAFAADVRLTFQNAKIYNGKGSDVFAMAELLLSLFEDIFYSAHQKLDGNQIKKKSYSVLVEKPVSNVATLNPEAANSGETADTNVEKPEMTAGEKAGLAARLSNLEMGPEGMDQIIAIVKKGVLGLAHEGDEIELDLEVLDNETLWELDSFIRSSSNKNTEGVVPNLASSLQANNGETMLEEQGRKMDEGEEDIDIGEEIPVTNFPFVEIEKDAVNVTSSSSSSSSGSDSSSSGSDSDCSSADDDSNEHNGNSDTKE